MSRVVELTLICGHMFDPRYFDMRSKQVKPLLKVLHPLFYEAEYLIKRAILEHPHPETVLKRRISMRTFVSVCILVMSRMGINFQAVRDHIPDFEALIGQLFTKYIKSRGNFRGFRLISEHTFSNDVHVMPVLPSLNPVASKTRKNPKKPMSRRQPLAPISRNVPRHEKMLLKNIINPEKRGSLI